MENDRDHRALRDELRLVRRDIAMLQEQYQLLVRDPKNLLGILERFGGVCLCSRKRPRNDITGEDAPRKRRRRTHPTGQLDRVCVALAVHYATGPIVLG